MICEQCGVEMNRHAEKIDYHAGLEEAELIDPAFGGVLEESHECPACGRGAVRPVEPASS